MYDYHDATLQTAILEWESGITTLTFALCIQPPKRATLTIRETSELECQRRFPWGKSVSVNRLDVQELDSGYRVEVEMQSGDKIRFFGAEVSEEVVE